MASWKFPRILGCNKPFLHWPHFPLLCQSADPVLGTPWPFENHRGFCKRRLDYNRTFLPDSCRRFLLQLTGVFGGYWWLPQIFRSLDTRCQYCNRRLLPQPGPSALWQQRVVACNSPRPLRLFRDNEVAKSPSLCGTISTYRKVFLKILQGISQGISQDTNRKVFLKILHCSLLIAEALISSSEITIGSALSSLVAFISGKG